MGKIPFNSGKIEFIAAADEINRLLLMGHTKRHIYNEIKNSGRFTMSYDTFCYHVRRVAAEIKSDSLEGGTRINKHDLAHQAFRPMQPKIIKSSPDELQDPRTIDPKSIF